MQPFAPLGRGVSTRGQKCGYSPGDTTDSDCQADATWHILWDSSGENGLACDPHMAEARARFVFGDLHRVGPDCAMPGTRWYFDQKRCAHPDEPTSLIAAAEQPTPAVHAQP